MPPTMITPDDEAFRNIERKYPHLDRNRKEDAAKVYQLAQADTLIRLYGLGRNSDSAN